MHNTNSIEPYSQGCIFRLTCSHPELAEGHVLTSAYIKIFRTFTRNEKKKLFLTSLKQTCNEYLIKFSENQSAPRLENRKTSPCSPCAPNLLHVLLFRASYSCIHLLNTEGLKYYLKIENQFKVHAAATEAAA